MEDRVGTGKDTTTTEKRNPEEKRGSLKHEGSDCFGRERKEGGLSLITSAFFQSVSGHQLPLPGQRSREKTK